LRRLHEIGVNFIDTADSYGPDVSEELIREALHPYEGLLIATKAGLTRPGPDQWIPNGRPAYLIAQAKGSLRKLGVEQIDLWQLHRIDPQVPRDEQFDAVRRQLDDGIIRPVDGVRRVSGRVTDHPLIERARTSPVPVAALIGFSIEPLGDGQAVRRLEAGPQHANPMGTLHKQKPAESSRLTLFSWAGSSRLLLERQTSAARATSCPSSRSG
jgi:hypothetical protein